MTDDKKSSLDPKSVHETALRQFDEIISVAQPERAQCVEDRRFYSIAGAQWEGDLSKEFANKPKLEVNKIHQSVIRIINEMRHNRITVNFVSRDSAVDKRLAETCQGLFRADEQDSSANEAYDNAFEEAVGGGFGAWRLRAIYEDDGDPEDDRQRISIEPITDADTSVYFDLNSKRRDKRDAKCCFVLTSMTHSAYEDTYGESPVSWPKDLDTSFDWETDDVVYVAEYYRVSKVKQKYIVYKRLDGEEVRHSEEELEADENLSREILSTGGVKVGERVVSRDRVRKWTLSGGGVLEDHGEIPGMYIPIVPVFGKRWFVDNIERMMGHVRLAKDVQRLKNMQLSKLAETAALSSVEKPIVTPDQIKGHQNVWATDSVENYAYLLVNPVEDGQGNIQPMGPVGYTKAPAIPQALAALLQITEVDMSDILGNSQAGEEFTQNISGKAVELVQGRLDMQSFIYRDNMAEAMKRSGHIWLSMARELFVEDDRDVRIVDKQDQSTTVQLNKFAVDKDGAGYISNDLSNAKFDVAVDTGPSSSSKRAATVRTIMGMMQVTSDPQTLKVLSSMAMMNVEGEGVDEIRDYFRRDLISTGAIEPTEEEQKELEEAAKNRPPDANEEYLKAAAKNEEAKAIGEMASTQKTKADTMLSLAKTEDTHANTAKTMSELGTPPPDYQP